MTACPKCGTELDDDVEFCPKDGATLKRQRKKSRPVTIDSPEAAGDPLIGRLLDGRYKVRARLGSGGVGSVYEADHVGTKRTVAIKTLHQMFADSAEFRKRFEREAQAASKLDHPGCVAVLDFGRVERVEPEKDAAKLHGTLYLVMEFVRGELLLDRIDRKGRIPAGEAIAIAVGMLGALAHAHSLGMIHRDIKPANIMVTPSGQVKLLDFGLAKDTAASMEPLTRAGLVFGTPGYLSPEQAGGKPIDSRIDLYAVGVVLFEMVTGRRLFPHKDPIDQVRDHLTREPDKPRSLVPSLSAELEAAILKALAKSPDDRFETAKEFADALERCPESSKAPKKPKGARTTVGKATAREGGRGPNVFALVAGVAILAGVGALGWLAYARSSWHAAPPPVAGPTAPLADAARRHLATAVSYQRKLWCSDAIEELERAVTADSRARTEREATRVAIACLTNRTQAKAVRFLVDRVGAPAAPALKAAAAGDANPDVRRGAARALERLP